MLKQLYIKNFVLINELNLDFYDGFSAFTGETGAGKSIFMDALSLLCGERASASFIAKGEEKAVIEGTFDLSDDQHARTLLQDAGFEIEDLHVFTREIHANGKSVSRIDHRVVSFSLVKNVLANELDIHGQRDNQYLLQTSTHIDLLDSFLQNEKLRELVEEKYRVYTELCKEKERILSEKYNDGDIEFFQYQLDEITSANLKSGEDEELEKKEKEFKLIKASFEELQGILSLYDDSIHDELYSLNHAAQNLDDSEPFTASKQVIADSYYNLEDAMETLRDFIGNMEISEDEINEIQERLFIIQKLKRKYGHTIDEIMSKQEELREKIEQSTNKEIFLSKIDRKISIALEDYRKSAEKLSLERKKGSKDLDQQILSLLKDLMMPNAVFKTDIRDSEICSKGIDHVEFMISMNKGQDLRSLSTTASGGELSRLMLGLKVIFSHLQGIQTVVFDEIDTGVSGPVATAIGRKMFSLSKDCQVFAVTHLAQVAACADHNYFVSKKEENNRTYTSVRELNYDGVIEQLALISSGEVTESSKLAAKELYQRNHN